MNNNKNIVSFWLVGYTLLMLMVGANIPSPLYGVYQQQLDFSSGVLTLIFAVYALVLIPSLLLFGQLSDQFGRKRVLFIGLLISGGGSIVFAAANSLLWLFIARGLQGLAAGMMSGTATAALIELRPRNRKTASLVASIATAGGTALGPIIGGLLAQYGPIPLILPYIVHLILLIPGFMAIFLMNETVKPASTGHWHPQWPSVPANIRTFFIIGAITAFAAWSVTALFMSLIPSYVSSLMDIHNLALTGGVVFLMLGASAVTQLTFKNLSIQTSMISGLILLIIGLAGILFAVPLQSILLLIISTTIAGVGQGLAFKGSMELVNGIAPANRRADVLSGFYVCIYIGVALPVIGIGFGAEQIGLYWAILIYACFIAIIAILMSFFITLRMKNTLNEEVPAI